MAPSKFPPLRARPPVVRPIAAPSQGVSQTELVWRTIAGQVENQQKAVDAQLALVKKDLAEIKANLAAQADAPGIAQATDAIKGLQGSSGVLEVRVKAIEGRSSELVIPVALQARLDASEKESARMADRVGVLVGTVAEVSGRLEAAYRRIIALEKPATPVTGTTPVPSEKDLLGPPELATKIRYGLSGVRLTSETHLVERLLDALKMVQSLKPSEAGQWVQAFADINSNYLCRIQASRHLAEHPPSADSHPDLLWLHRFSQAHAKEKATLGGIRNAIVAASS